MPLFVDIIGTADKFAGLRTLGVLIDDHGQSTLPDGQWVWSVYVSSQAVVDQLRARGLVVEVLEDEGQVEQEGIDIERELDDEDQGTS
jgi:hypothetical protein